MARFPLLLLGIVFLASVSVSFAVAYWEQESPSHYNKCLQSCRDERDPFRVEACRARCKLSRDTQSSEQDDEEEESHPGRPRHHSEPESPKPRHHGAQEDEDEDEDEEKPRGHPSPRPRPRPHPRPRQQEEDEDEDEWPSPSSRRHPSRSRSQQQHKQSEDEEEDESDEGQEESQSQSRRNPFLFRSNRFQTLYKNQYGRIRVLERFERRSNRLQNLRNYRLVEFSSKPNTLLLPHHSDADFILVVLNGKAILTLVYPDDKNSYNLECGDAIRIPAGITFYLINRDENQNLRIIKLAVPVNRPGKFQDFFPSNTEDQQSYLRGFSKRFLEASLDSSFKEIQRVLLEGEQQSGGQQSEEEGVIVQFSKDKIQELSRHAKSSSRKSSSSENEPFNLRSRSPIYSNKFGKFYEITPEKNPQLKELDVYISNVEINEGGLLLPHLNSRAIVIVAVNKGRGNLELVGLREEQRQQEEDEDEQEQEDEQEEREVKRYRANLRAGDIIVIPSSYPVAVNASSKLNLVGFGINAENNQRSFLAGEKGNVISRIDREVNDAAYPGSGEDVHKLLKEQKESYFADGQPQQSEQGNKGRRSPLSSILGAFA
ncbi:hypothetical protein RJT34_25156 [Clitoria ternatea]|uniref:Cupin type-1 domain-containing protein n=1 Tax=Clitoria ternatea TaxID=43366 RepID=A0AAN9FPE3_CLITE